MKKRKAAELGALKFQESFLKEVESLLQEFFSVKGPHSKEQLIEVRVFCFVALEIMKEASPSRLRDAARKVNLDSSLASLDMLIKRIP